MDRRDAVTLMAGLGAASLLKAPELTAQPSNCLTAQSQPVIVEALIAGGLRLPHLRAQQAGGVHCGMSSGPGEMNSWSRDLKFFDRMSQEVVHAKSVVDIRKARADGRMSHVYGWQAADALGNAFNGTMGNTDTPLRAFYEMGETLSTIAK
jgi:hypothetical protein